MLFKPNILTIKYLNVALIAIFVYLQLLNTLKIFINYK